MERALESAAGTDMLKERLFDLLIGGLAGFVLAAGLSLTCYDKQMRQLQEYSHTVKVSAIRITTRARATSSSYRRVADSLRTAGRAVLRVVEQDTALAELAERSLASARTVRDTNVALRLENQALRRSVTNLWVALALARHEADTLRARGDSLDRAVDSLNLHIMTLTSRIEDLKPPPKWFRYSIEAIKIGGALWGGYQWGKHDRANIPPTQTAVHCPAPPYQGPC
jgi:hypothetical protein